MDITGSVPTFKSRFELKKPGAPAPTAETQTPEQVDAFIRQITGSDQVKASTLGPAKGC